MRGSTLSLRRFVVLLYLGLTAPMAMALDGGNATVSFGQCQTGPVAGLPPVLELDRFPDVSPRLWNQHQLIPHHVTIKASGAVNFPLGGLHQVIVYEAS